MIIIITGMPGAGKSYSACDLIVRAWKKNPNKRIFTNFPVKWKNHSTMKWEPGMLKENIIGSLIVIDEAYRDFYSRNWKSFNEEDLLTFATSRHNENVYVLISQSLASVDTEIRRRAEIWWVSKVALPNPRYLLQYDMWRPIWITTEVYDGEENYKMRLVVGKKAILRRRRTLFKKWIAKVYDTHFYGLDTTKPYMSETWFKIESSGKKEYKIISFLKPYLHKCISNLTLWFDKKSYTWAKPGLTLRLNRMCRIWIKKKVTDKIKYNLWEKRPLYKTILHINYLIWKPIINFFNKKPYKLSPDLTWCDDFNKKYTKLIKR